MSALSAKLAEYGFESNDDYDYLVRCLFATPYTGIRLLNIEGDGERRKTAFAVALARALDYPQILYHDFTDTHPPLPDVILPPTRDELGRMEPPIEPLDRVVSEACAHSEGEPTALIVDQLQAADFREHLRLYRLIKEGIWEVRGAPYVANPRHLFVILISKAPIYHSLRKEGFRLWIGRLPDRRTPFQPADFGLGPEAEAVFAAINRLFELFDVAPTHGELARLLVDLRLHVRTLEHLRLSLYGRLESVEREQLNDERTQDAQQQLLDTARAWLLVEHIEYGTD
ncbi:hypothetical protein GWK36_05770 [Caldichromatium japonicum]|uniref:ATP-binding protein n=2 Tax=Caldichromatium japonicum TaxID=2699430 RepID=A0A6G7VH61_9GAMM|nr:hypothetical protein GWK36_05770 [Caldichromatium japonicum]